MQRPAGDPLRRCSTEYGRVYGLWWSRVSESKRLLISGLSMVDRRWHDDLRRIHQRLKAPRFEPFDLHRPTKCCRRLPQAALKCQQIGSKHQQPALFIQKERWGFRRA
jgi:hypothetical protein